jgi:hypothetical protein
MKQSEIQVGKTYSNGKGKLRMVYDIIRDPNSSFPPEVLYKTKGRKGTSWLDYFARWAKEVVEDE